MTATAWVTTTASEPWRVREGPVAESAAAADLIPDVIVQMESPRQTIEGFGACFNELGWTSLSALTKEQRDGIFQELFAPGVGANFTLCRMPVGANDFSRDWYSYDETPNDFALEHFSVANDLETLVPFIKSAQTHQPALRLWASPWSPPSWMKQNKHYAAAMPAPWQRGVENGLRPDQVGKEGTDMFIQEEPYFRAYASYIGRFIDEYRKRGIQVGMVMPQNEFNSPQVFPSCTWTPEGLARFIGYLGPEMDRRNVEVFFGTMERPNMELLEVSLRDPVAGKYVKGAGFQWAGKGAIADVHREHPNLRLYQTEQECGDGRNDWRFCRYTWSLIKHYFRSGACAYMYWNISLEQGGISRWGWAQNSLVTVETAAKAFVYNHEYYLMKHLSHFVRPGARYLETASWTGYENQIAFANPDGSTVVVMQNDLSEKLPVRLLVGDRVIVLTLPADSFNTFVVEPEPPAKPSQLSPHPGTTVGDPENHSHVD
jgi:glucosylceramidase